MTVGVAKMEGRAMALERIEAYQRKLLGYQEELAKCRATKKKGCLKLFLHVEKFKKKLKKLRRLRRKNAE